MKDKERVMRKLARKSYSSWELRQKCQDVPEIDTIVAEFIEKGYLNDDEWLDNYIHSQEVRGTSPLAIAAKLRTKGVPTAILQAKLTTHSPDTALQTLIQKKTKGHPPSGPDKQKLIAFLQRRGFSWEAICRVLKI